MSDDVNNTGLSKTLQHILDGGVHETAAGLGRIRWRIEGSIPDDTEEIEQKIRDVLNSDSFCVQLKRADSNQKAAEIVATIFNNIGCATDSTSVLAVLDNGCF